MQNVIGGKNAPHYQQFNKEKATKNDIVSNIVTLVTTIAYLFLTSSGRTVNNSSKNGR